MWKMQQSVFDWCSGVSLLSRGSECFRKNDFGWLNWAKSLYYTRWGLLGTQKQDGSTPDQVAPLLKDKDGGYYRSWSGVPENEWVQMIRSWIKEIYYLLQFLFWIHDWFSLEINPRSCLSLNCTLALWVYGMGKYKTFTGMYLSGFEDALSDSTSTIKRIQKFLK